MEEQLKKSFKNLFGCDPEYIVKCPGRVNLIGEHIDYSGYGVLPMAIDCYTYILVSSRNDQKISFFNSNPVYPAHEHKISDEWMGSKKPEWHHYFLCGWKGILEHFKIVSKGINVFLSGSIPPSSGLSSSSSIVCASALATLALHTGKTFDLISKVELAELCAKIERYIGTEGGGMDQAVEILAEAGVALMIEFNPVRPTKVVLPQGALFAVLHCGAVHDNAATSHYNERVVECRIAAQIMAKRSGIEDWKAIRTLGQLANKLNKTAPDMVPIVKKILSGTLYDRLTVTSILGIKDDELKTLSLSANTQHMNQFKLSQRALHVYSEAARVTQFKDACLKGDINKLGELMNESHASCRDLYECSCPELDQTVEKCIKNKALGARLTGAGWGGCVVALFTEKQPDFSVLFWSQPGGGIQITRCN